MEFSDGRINEYVFFYQADGISMFQIFKAWIFLEKITDVNGTIQISEFKDLSKLFGKGIQFKKWVHLFFS